MRDQPLALPSTDTQPQTITQSNNTQQSAQAGKVAVALPSTDAQQEGTDKQSNNTQPPVPAGQAGNVSCACLAPLTPSAYARRQDRQM